MHAISIFAQAVGTKLMVWLVNHGAPYVLAGTLGLAGLGAAISNPAPARGDHPTAQTGNAYSYLQAAHHCDHDQDGGSGNFYAGY